MNISDIKFCVLQVITFDNILMVVQTYNNVAANR